MSRASGSAADEAIAKFIERVTQQQKELSDLDSKLKSLRYEKDSLQSDITMQLKMQEILQKDNLDLTSSNYNAKIRTEELRHQLAKEKKSQDNLSMTIRSIANTTEKMKSEISEKNNQCNLPELKTLEEIQEQVASTGMT